MKHPFLITRSLLLLLSSFTLHQAMEVEPLQPLQFPCEIWQNIILQSGEEDIPKVLSTFYETCKTLRKAAWRIRRHRFQEASLTWTGSWRYNSVKISPFVSFCFDNYPCNQIRITSFDKKLRLAHHFQIPLNIQIYHYHQDFPLDQYDFSYVSQLEVPVCVPRKENYTNNKVACDIAQILNTSKILKTLIFTGYCVSDVGCIDIAKALETNKTLTFLDMRCNKAGNASAKALGEALKKNHTLTHCQLVLYHLHDEDHSGGIRPLIEGLIHNTALETFEMIGGALSNHSKYGIKGGFALATLFKTNKTLKKFNWCVNFIPKNAAAIIATQLLEALNMNTTLTNLNLPEILNQSETCINLLAQFIKTNTSIVVLDLRRHDIFLPLYNNHNFINALMTNTTLKKIFFSVENRKIFKEMAAFKDRLEIA